MKVKGWKKICHTSGNIKRTVVAMLRQNKIHFKKGNISSEKEFHNDKSVNTKGR